jgi:uncharacterized RDD family membrane protein YckC
MKCPKCGYLGFEAADRCRNCGYDFSLARPAPQPDFAIHHDISEARASADLPLVDAPLAASAPAAASDHAALDHDSRLETHAAREMVTELPLFGGDADDVPLVSASRPPRPPLAVRRSTPEVPRLRTLPPRTPMLDLESAEAGDRSTATGTTSRPRREPAQAPESSTDDNDAARPAPLGARFAALVIDLVILLMIDAAVVYFTIQICSLTMADLAILPKGPLAAFLLVQNGGYLVAFTAGGQTLGKMTMGIKVVPVEPGAPLDVGQALTRTVIWAALAIPAGLGFLSALLSGDRRGLHDRLAGTKVVRASA